MLKKCTTKKESLILSSFTKNWNVAHENEILEKSPDFVLNDTTATGKNPNEIVEQESNKENFIRIQSIIFISWTQ